VYSIIDAYYKMEWTSWKVGTSRWLAGCPHMRKMPGKMNA
jgi:hypothetical protein